MAVRDEKAIVEIIIKGQQPNATLKEIERSARALRAQLSRLPADSAEFVKKSEELKKVNTRLAHIREDIKGTGSMFQWLGKEVKAFGVLALGFLGFSFLTSQAQNTIRANAELSDSLADIRKTTGMTDEEVKRLNKTFTQMDTRTSTKELRQIAIAAGQLGISKDEILKFTAATDKMAVSLSDEFSGGAMEVTRVMGGLRTIFKDIATDQIDQDLLHIGNAVNALASSGAATGPVVTDFANRIGGVGINLGLTSAQVLGTSATLQELQVSTERGGTAITRILQKMVTHIPEFAKVAGMSVKDFATLVNTDLFGAFQKVLEGSKKSGESATAMGHILDGLGVDGAGASEVMSKLGNNMDLLNKRVDLAGTSLKGTSSIMNEFNIKNHTLAADMDRLGKVLNTAFTNSSFQKFLKNTISGLAEFFSKTPEVVKLSEAWRNQKTVVDELSNSMTPLLDRHDQLKSKTNLNKDEQKELKDTIQKIAEVTPIAVTEFDKYGKAMDISTEKGRLFLKMEQEKLEIMNKEALQAYRLELIKTNEQLNRLKSVLSRRDSDGDIYQTITEKIGTAGDKASYVTKEVKLTNEEIINLQKNITEESNKLIGLYATINELSGQPGKKPIPQGGPDRKDSPFIDEEEAKKIKQRYEKLVAELKELSFENAIFNEEEWQKSISKIMAENDELKKRILSDTMMSAKERSEALITLETNTQNKIGEINTKHLKEVQDKVEEALSARRKLNQTAEQNELEDAEKKFADVYTKLKEANQSTEGLEEEKQKALAAIRKKYSDKEAADQKKLQEEIFKATHTARENQIEDVARFYDELILKAKEAGMSTLDLEHAKAEKIREINKQLNDKIEKDNLTMYRNLYQSIMGIVSQYMQLKNQEENQMYQEALTASDNQAKQELAKQDRLLKAKIINQDDYDRELGKINERKADRDRAEAEKLAEYQKRSAIFNAIINGAEAITKIWAQWAAYPIVAAALTAVSAGVTTAQIDYISKESAPQYASGGYHEPEGYTTGAALYGSSTGRPFVAGEAGREYIVSNPMLQNPYVANQVAIMEAMRQGRTFAEGGYNSGAGRTSGSSAGNDAISYKDLVRVLYKLDQRLAGGITAKLNYDTFTKDLNSIDSARDRSAIQ